MKTLCISFSQGHGIRVKDGRIVEFADLMIFVNSGDVLPLDPARSHTLSTNHAVEYYVSLDYLTKNGRVPEAPGFVNVDKDGKLYDESNPNHDSHNDFYAASREVINELYPGAAKFIANYKYIVINTDPDIKLIFAKIKEKLRQKGYQFIPGTIERNTYYDDNQNEIIHYPLEGEARTAFQSWRNSMFNGTLFSHRAAMSADSEMARYHGDVPRFSK